jgi:hypothetical protein
MDLKKTRKNYLLFELNVLQILKWGERGRGRREK